MGRGDARPLGGERRAGGLGDGADLAETGRGSECVGELVDGGESVVVEDRAIRSEDQIDGGDDAAGVVGFDDVEPGS